MAGRRRAVRAEPAGPKPGAMAGRTRALSVRPGRGLAGAWYRVAHAVGLAYGLTASERSGKGGDTRPGRRPAAKALWGRPGGSSEANEVGLDRCQDRGRDPGCIPRSALAHCDAAGLNGRNRILFHGAPNCG